MVSGFFGLRFWAKDFGNMVSGFFGLRFWAKDFANMVSGFFGLIFGGLVCRRVTKWTGARCRLSRGGGGRGGGGGGRGGWVNRRWSVSLCRMGGLALHGKAARVPPPYPPPPPRVLSPPPRFGGVRRERGRFSPPFPIQHAARVGGP